MNVCSRNRVLIRKISTIKYPIHGYRSLSLPVTLGDTLIESVLPSYNKEIIQGIKHFIVEDVRSARRFLKKVDREIDIDSLTFTR